MEQIVIQVKDKKKAQALKDFLQTLDFVESVSQTAMSRKGRQAKAPISFPWRVCGPGVTFHRKACAKKPGRREYDPLRHNYLLNNHSSVCESRLHRPCSR